MRLATVRAVGAVASAPIPLDFDKTWFGVGLAVYVISGSVSYTVQYTFDDVFAAGYDPSAGVWFNHDDSDLVGATTAQAGNFMFPVTACRVVNADTGTAELRVLQAGGR